MPTNSKKTYWSILMALVSVTCVLTTILMIGATIGVGLLIWWLASSISCRLDCDKSVAENTGLKMTYNMQLAPPIPPPSANVFVRKPLEVLWTCHPDLNSDGQTFTFINKGKSEWRSCRAKKPLQYFELKITQRGVPGSCNSHCIAVGFSDEAMPLFGIMVGSVHGTYAYVSNGTILQPSMASASNKFDIGDTVGVWQNFQNGQMIFMKNGQRVGKLILNNGAERIYPTVSLINPQDTVDVNLGPHFLYGPAKESGAYGK